MFTPAFAQTAGRLRWPVSDVFMQVAPFAAILVIMYFLLLRPQQKKQKLHREMISAVRRGDTVVTAGGLIGKVTKSTDATEVEVEIAPNVRVRLSRAMITEVRAKGEPVRDAAAPGRQGLIRSARPGHPSDPGLPTLLSRHKEQQP